MKQMHLILAILAFIATSGEANECETSCSDRCYAVVAEYERVAEANRAYCSGGGGGRPNCVPNCADRYNDGTCRVYGPDYCGPQAACAPNCTQRYNDGSCRTYGADYCGPDAYCFANCLSRYNDGSCRTYGSDVCY